MHGGYAADVLKHPSLCGTYHIHHVFLISPFLTFQNHPFKESAFLDSCTGVPISGRQGD